MRWNECHPATWEWMCASRLWEDCGLWRQNPFRNMTEKACVSKWTRGYRIYRTSINIHTILKNRVQLSFGSTWKHCGSLQHSCKRIRRRSFAAASQHDRGCSSRGSSHLRRPMVNDSLLGSGTLHRLLRAQGGAGQVLTWTNAPTVPTLVDLQVNPSAEDVRGCATIGRGQTWRPGDSANLVCFYFCGIMKCPMFGISMDAHGCPWIPNLYTCPNENEELIHCWH